MVGKVEIENLSYEELKKEYEKLYRGYTTLLGKYEREYMENEIRKR